MPHKLRLWHCVFILLAFRLCKWLCIIVEILSVLFIPPQLNLRFWWHYSSENVFPNWIELNIIIEYILLRKNCFSCISNEIHFCLFPRLFNQRFGRSEMIACWVIFKLIHQSIAVLTLCTLVNLATNISVQTVVHCHCGIWVKGRLLWWARRAFPGLTRFVENRRVILS